MKFKYHDETSYFLTYLKMFFCHLPSAEKLNAQMKNLTVPHPTLNIIYSVTEEDIRPIPDWPAKLLTNCLTGLTFSLTFSSLSGSR